MEGENIKLSGKELNGWVDEMEEKLTSIRDRLDIMETEKEILCQLGFDFGKARMPFSELDDAVKAELKREITDRL